MRSLPSMLAIVSFCFPVTTTTEAIPLPDAEICDAWQKNTCTDDPCFRWKGHEEKTCDWIGRRNKRATRICRRRKAKNRCPETCQIPECREDSASPSATPSASPSTSPTEAAVDDVAYPRGKKGICYTLREPDRNGSYLENLPKIRSLNPSWTYSWGPDTPAGVPTTVLPTGGVEITGGTSNNDEDGIDFVPMLWGYYPGLFEDFTDRMLNPNPNIVLGFNEPDSSSQSNLSVQYALEGWERLANKVTEMTDDSILVSPSCVQPTGSWCSEFIDAVDDRGMRLDAIGFHWYGGASPQTLFDSLTETYERFGNRPILITEFAVADWNAASVNDNKFSPEQVLDFMKGVLPWLESTEWILGYAWFSFELDSRAGWVSSLVQNSDSTTGEVVLTPLGEYYASFQSV